MQFRYLLLALVIVVIWGLNFVFVTVGLEGIPPLFMVFLRLFLTSLPAIFFIKKPQLPFRKIAAYGLTMFALQFSLAFVGINLGVTPGLASVLNQTQLFFSLFFAFLFLREKCTLWQIIGAFISFSGIMLIAMHIGGEVSLIGLLLIVCSAAGWGAGNVLSKTFSNVDAISLICWSSLIAWPVVLMLSLLLEGPEAILYSMNNISRVSIISILYITYLSTFFAYSAWSWLLRRLPLATVAPFALLVPVFGMLGSALALGEPLPPWKLAASALVISGLSLNLLGPMLLSDKMKIRLRWALDLARPKALEKSG